MTSHHIFHQTFLFFMVHYLQIKVSSSKASVLSAATLSRPAKLFSLWCWAIVEDDPQSSFRWALFLFPVKFFITWRRVKPNYIFFVNSSHSIWSYCSPSSRYFTDLGSLATSCMTPPYCRKSRKWFIWVYFSFWCLWWPGSITISAFVMTCLIWCMFPGLLNIVERDTPEFIQKFILTVKILSIGVFLAKNLE